MADRPYTLKVFPDASELTQAAAALFTERVRESCRERGVFTAALSGGSTPRALYRELARNTAAGFWDRVHLFWGDERFVPPDHPESNFGMTMAALAGAPIPAENIHRVPTELSSPAEAAAAYERTLRDVFSAHRLLLDGRPRFDLVLLGMGADGHTASLFPGDPALRERNRLARAVRADRLPVPDRITLTVPVFDAARLVVFLVAGAEKAATLRAVLEGPHDPDRLPSQAIRPGDGELLWLVDEAAAGLLSR